jgi:archaemetzincin
MTEPITPKDTKPVVAVIPFGSVPLLAAKVVSAHVSGYLGLAAETLPPMEIPAEAFCERRLQYNVAPLIHFIEAMPLKRYCKVIGVLNVDLFIPVFTHVFGEARQNGRAALVSLFRLKTDTDGTSPSADRLLERVAKIGLHELGHLLNLLHCDDERCLMHFCGDVEKLDRIEIHFCRYCRNALRRAVIRY